MLEQQIEKDLLKKLLHHKMIGEKHTSIHNLPKSFPKHLRGTVKDVIKDLLRKGLLRLKPTSYGPEVSINTERLEEIKRIIFE